MRKLNDITGDEAFETVEKIVSMSAEIMKDDEMKSYVQRKKDGIKFDPLPWMAAMLKNHRQTVLELISLLEGKTVDEYKAELTAVKLKNDFLEMCQDSDIIALFL